MSEQEPGALQKAKGMAKEAIGAVKGDEDMQAEGRQKRKGGVGTAGDYVLAIDQGTTGTTAMIFNHDGEIVGQAYSEFTQHYPKPGWVEHDANEIWDVSMQVAEEALSNAGVSANDIATIGLQEFQLPFISWPKRR